MFEHKKYGTQFTESEALLAIQADDRAHASWLVGQMLPKEKTELAIAAARLARLCRGEL